MRNSGVIQNPKRTRQMSLTDDYICVIRSAGERTTEGCKKIVSRETPMRDLYVIEEVPFEEAIKESFRIGLKRNKKWLVTLDADVLPRPQAIQEMLSQANRGNRKIIAFTGLIYDKFLATFKTAGNHVYRTEHLKAALDYIPHPGSTVRPESTTIKKTKELGLKRTRLNIVVGLHDFEQYYSDIYRKFFLHAQKRTEAVAGLLKFWKKKSQLDFDYKVAIKGAVDGMLFEERARTDIRMYSRLAERALNELGLQEKAPLCLTNVERWVHNSIPINKQPYYTNRIAKIKSLYEERGAVSSTLQIIAKTFQYLSEKTCNYNNK